MGNAQSSLCPNSISPDGPPTLRKDQGPAHSPSSKIPSYSKCLRTGHLRKQCSNLVRCRSCYNYGHVSAACLSKSRNHRLYRPISKFEGEGADKSFIPSEPPCSSPPSPNRPPSSPPCIEENPNAHQTMANSVNPCPHLEPVPHPPLHHEVFVMGCYTAYNEDLAIVRLRPAVHKDDFESLSTAVRSFF